MRFMNEFDLEVARRRYKDHPNRMRLISTVDALRVWADANSDGWAYWPKPARAAVRAMEIIEGDGTNDAFYRDDCTPAEVRAAEKPIRRFLSRHDVSPLDVIGGPWEPERQP